MRGLAISIGATIVFMSFMVGPYSLAYRRATGLDVMLALGAGFLIPLGIILEIVDFARRRRATKKDSSLEPLRERIITERVLVICPFCSTKVEQGVAFCPNCGGKM